jgi:hypothetical protein
MPRIEAKRFYAHRGDTVPDRFLKCLCLCALAKCHNGGLPFADGDGHVGNYAMTIPDYLAIGLLLMMLLAAARWFAQRKFEL